MKTVAPGTTRSKLGRHWSRLRRGRRPRPEAQIDPSLLEEARYTTQPETLTRGNRVVLLIDGEETFPAMLQAIAGARHYVHLETYIVADDETGARFAVALKAAAARGAQVRFLFDSVGSVTLPDDYVEDLRGSGVEVVEFRPVRRFLFSEYLTRRDHRKILVVDGHTGFTGGLNLSNDYTSAAGGPGWRDTHARVQGPVVAQLEEAFARTWLEAGGLLYSVEAPETEADPDAPSPEGSVVAGVMVSDGELRQTIRRQYIHAIDLAGRHISIANAYFVPDRRIVAALIAAVARGVEVNVIVPERSDVPVVQWACEYLFEKLLRSGIKIHYWQDVHMHAKTAVVDGVWSTVGSYNLDGISRLRNKEVILQVIDEDFAARMMRQFEKDLGTCDPLERNRWARRSMRRKFLEWACYRFRTWL